MSELRITASNYTQANGWYNASNTKKYHFFVDGKPACGQRVFGTKFIVMPLGFKQEVDALSKPENLKHYGYCDKCVKKHFKK